MDVAGDKERSFQTVVGDPLMLDKAILSVPGKVPPQSRRADKIQIESDR